MKTFDLINKQNTTGMSLAQRANMELSDPMVNNNMNNIQDFELNPSVNTFSDSVSESGAGIYGSQNQRQRSVGYPQDDNSPLLQKGLATKKDSTFVKKYHPTFTGGYLNKSQNEIEANKKSFPNTPKKNRKSINETIIQSNKIQQNESINLANKKGIDTKMWKASNKGIPL
tara:strand:- start:257 stop:769 length:513 start_codon:yes stop_codon:yes gene_type:complete